MDLAVFHEDAKISTEPYICEYTENASGRCDTLYMAFRDEEQELAGLDIQKGGEVQAVHGASDTGAMFISEIRRAGELLTIKALSMPSTIIKAGNAAWEKVSFMELIQDVADETGLSFSIDRPVDVYYREVSRYEQSPAEFLEHRLSLESYAMRIHDKTIRIYDERAAENADYAQQLWQPDFSKPPEFSTSDAGLISRVENQFITAEGERISTAVESGISGRIIRKNMAVSSIEESERFSYGIMRSANKYEFVSEGKLDGTGYSACQTVWLVDAPEGHAGLNFIYRVVDDFIGDTQIISMRKPIAEGY